MTTAVNINRQSVLSAFREVSFDDFTSGTAKNIIALEPGTWILRGYLDVTTAWNSETSDLVTIGDTVGTDDVDRYITTASTTSLQAAARTAFSTPPITSGWITAVNEWLTMTVTSVDGAGELDQGSAIVVIEYINLNRRTEYYPVR